MHAILKDLQEDRQGTQTLLKKAIKYYVTFREEGSFWDTRTDRDRQQKWLEDKVVVFV
jgi:hypothetical protein